MKIFNEIIKIVKQKALLSKYQYIAKFYEYRQSIVIIGYIFSENDVIAKDMEITLEEIESTKCGLDFLIGGYMARIECMLNDTNV